MSIDSLKLALREFALQRDWDQFHTPKNLAMALAGEAGEVLEIFQWLTEEQAQPDNLAPASMALAKQELGDVLLYLIRLADKLNIDLEEAAEQKLLLNEEKYPVELSKGNAVKYNRRNE